MECYGNITPMLSQCYQAWYWHCLIKLIHNNLTLNAETFFI